MDQNPCNLALAQLRTFLENVPTYIRDETVRRYHEILSELEAASGESLRQFRIPDDKVAPRIAAVQRRGATLTSGVLVPTKDKYCDADYFKSQVEGLCRHLKTSEMRHGEAEWEQLLIQRTQELEAAIAGRERAEAALASARDELKRCVCGRTINPEPDVARRRRDRREERAWGLNP